MARTLVAGVVAALVAVVLGVAVLVVAEPGGSDDRRIETNESQVTTDGWTPLPPSGLGHRTNVAAVWTGSEVLVWGGNVGIMYYQQGAAYDPATGTWRKIASNRWAGPGTLSVWTGEQLVVVGKRSGAVYNVAQDSWKELGYLPDGVNTGFGGLAWSGSDLYGAVWGADDLRIARYDALNDRWTMSSGQTTSGGSRNQGGNLATWVGDEVVIWGGARSGWAYRPSSDTWRTLPELKGNLPHLASKLIVVGTRPTLVYAYDGVAGRMLGVAQLDQGEWTTIVEASSPDFERPSAATDGQTIYAVDVQGSGAPTRVDLPTKAVIRIDGAPLSSGSGKVSTWSGTGLFVWGGIPADTTPSTNPPESAWYQG